MGFFNKFFPKKNKTKQTQTISGSLFKKLDEKQIPYITQEKENDDDDFDYKVIYFDILEDIKAIYTYKNGKYYASSHEISEDLIYRKFEIFYKEDEMLRKFVENYKFNEFFKIDDYFKAELIDKGVNRILRPAEDKISVLYAVDYKPTEDEYDFGLSAEKGPNEEIIIKSLPDKKEKDVSTAITYVVQKLFEVIPVLFVTGVFDINNGLEYDDFVKTYIINKTLADRLNQFPNVEAQIINIENGGAIFVMFYNGSALKYFPPTKSKKSNIVIMDIDEDNKVEDNNEYSIIMKLLKLPDMLHNKPD